MRRGSLQRFFFITVGTGFYSGYVPFIPGTAGTAAGIAVFWLFSHLPPLLYVITLLAFIFLSAWIAEGVEEILQQRDAPPIVIDEIAGYMVTMALIPWSLQAVGIGFVLFRVFDITKLFPVNWAERRFSGGWGITLDDDVAGVYANIVLRGILQWL
jgi:phosphatidylglycerophosphatase A